MNVPQLRFDGFDGEWEEVTLKTVIDNMVSGVSVNSTDIPARQGKTGVLKTSSISKGRFYAFENKEILDEDIKRAKINPLKKKILISRMNTPQLVGEIGYIENDYPNLFLPDRLWMATTTDSVDSKWLTYLLVSNRYNSQILNLATGTSNSMKNISKESFFSLNIFVPDMEEQQRIASFLSILDKKIEAQQEKIEKLEQFKKGIMQKIFSQELRFKDEDGGEFPEWEAKRLDELGSFYKGTGLSKSHLTPEGKPCILYGELYTKYSSVITKVYSYCNPNAKAFLGEVTDVLIPSSGETAWDIACASALNVAGVSLGGDLNVFRPNEQINGNFISYQINSIKKYELSNLAQGASVVHLYSAALKKLKISVPVYEEQLKISNYLSKLDTKIEKEKEKLMVLEDQKRGFMYQLFI